MTTYEQSQQSDWLQTELELMSSQADSPAKTSQLLANKQEYNKELEAAYGQSALVYLGTFDLNTPSLKTSQTCLMDTGEIGLSEYCGTFPRSGMMRSGTVYQLPNLARTITEIGSGLFATPDTQGFSNKGSLQLIAKKARTWDEFNGMSHRASKKKKEQFWPTPTAHNAKEGAYPAEYERNTPTLAAQAGGKLNPTWVEWLMGFPLGHTDLNA